MTATRFTSYASARTRWVRRVRSDDRRLTLSLLLVVWILFPSGTGPALPGQGPLQSAARHQRRGDEHPPIAKIRPGHCRLPDGIANPSRLRRSTQPPGPCFYRERRSGRCPQGVPGCRAPATGYADARSNLGLVLLRKGDLDGAIVELRSAVDLDPSSSQSHFRLGLALSTQGIARAR